MAESRRCGIGNQLDIGQILLEAQNRWLRPAEICEILQNYKSFRIAPEPPQMPPSGSLFLFDRKVLRYFRKDGHNWRKKKDGKTVKEAHERLKSGSVDVLHCYYAHGEENENFQRRSYWMLEEELSHIVLVHYREVKGSRTNFNRINETEDAFPNSQENGEILPSPEMDTSVSSRFQSYQAPSQTTDTTSLNSAQASEYEDAESAYNHQASSTFRSFVDLQQPLMEKTNPGLAVPYFPVQFSNDYEGKLLGTPVVDFASLTREENHKDANDVALAYGAQKQLDLPSWEDMLESCTTGIQSVPFQSSLSSTQANSICIIPKQDKEIMGQLFTDGFAKKQEFGNCLPGQEEWQVSSESDFANLAKWPVDQKLPSDSGYDLQTSFNEQKVQFVNLNNYLGPCGPGEQIKHPMQNGSEVQLSNADCQLFLKSESVSNVTIEGKNGYPSAARQHLLDGSLAKIDSFNRWMSKELGDVDESHIQSSSGVYWDAVGTENGVDPSIPPQVHLESYTVAPSISQDQLFTIIDFSPNWAYAGSETKILVMGKFLKSPIDAENCKWSCMFGEVEVPAEVVANGVLRCHTPSLTAGRVPFYVTCSNRLACSEVREFEYRVNPIEDVDIADAQNDSTDETLLHMRLGKLLSLRSVSDPTNLSCSVGDKSHLTNKINSLMKVDDDDEWIQMLMLTSEEKFSTGKVKEQLLQKLLKERLYIWLLQKEAEGGKGPNVLDEEGGQGVLHLAAALGYDWAIPLTVAAGVSVNFRDVHGWTALHWAASRGKERTVVSLISLGAAPGALTDPSPIYPSGRTPADLASAKGHKGIAGYLAESALIAQLSYLNLKDTKERDSIEMPGVKAVQTIAERSPTPISHGDLPYEPSMKDSLAAVCNATQTAARIHQVFRVQSFQQKQLKEYGDDELGMSDERALSLIAVKAHRLGKRDEPVHAAATAAIRIQNKFRSWKGRKEFLIIRQRIVKIQAHVRGHQVRKNYRKIVWSVGIVEKVILRWRRKGCGLRGFKREAITEGPSRDITSKEDDYDFLKEGRKQTEERLQKALARVKSMVQYPEARDQYRRLLTVVTEIEETKAMEDRIISSEETVDFDEDLIHLQAFLDDDTFMPNAA
ncbi:calmodulin-binding transcription activator 3 [Malania oleifera]|uniref:calmodulin-binding transcription activator 3 n=1 Tax=Malania oleifera TaxID=397392 RepID=UPI0025ADC8A4|nr:calmodulin-binding transcription activator 3 [Malania oleifera]